VIVVDASAAVLGLLTNGDARQALSSEALAIPDLADAEVAQALRMQEHRGRVDETVARTALDRWSRLGVVRHRAVGLLPRVWELRSNLTAYDATYVALAEQLECALLTADARLARAPGPRCVMTVIRR
jgi:predicted nucleic acid-binding protein